MREITICNINAFDNGYLTSGLFTDYNKFCVEKQKSLVGVHDDLIIRYKMFDYNDGIVKEAKLFLKDYIYNLTKNNFDISNEKERLKKITDIKITENYICVAVDLIRLYILSKIPNLFFLDDDMLITNVEDFLNFSRKRKKIYCDFQSYFNLDKTEKFKTILKKRCSMLDILSDRESVKEANIETYASPEDFGCFHTPEFSLDLDIHKTASNINEVYKIIAKHLNKMKSNKCLVILSLNKNLDNEIKKLINKLPFLFHYVPLYKFDESTKVSFLKFLKER